MQCLVSACVLVIKKNCSDFSEANFIYQNYRQALEKIQTDGRLLAALSVCLKTTNADYERYLEEERYYLKLLQVEPDTVQTTADYMELLVKLDSLQYVRYSFLRLLYVYSVYVSSCESEKAKVEFQMLDYNIINKGYMAVKIREVRTRYTMTYSRWEACNMLVCEFEEAHGIEERWIPAMQAYKDAQLLMTEWKYHRVLDELEWLVVQRLFEMTKLGMSSVGKSLV